MQHQQPPPNNNTQLLPQQPNECLLKDKSGKIEDEGEDNADEEEGFQDEDDDYKMVFVVRMDLKLGVGKIAQLVATATLKAYQLIQQASKVDELKEYALLEWAGQGQSKKIVVKAPSEQQLIQTLEKAKKVNINCLGITQSSSRLVPKEQKPLPKKERKREKKQEKKVEGIVQVQTSNPKEELDKNNLKDKQHSEKIKSEVGKKERQKKVKGPEQVAEKSGTQQVQTQQQILVLGVFGPASDSELDPFTKHFKLF